MESWRSGRRCRSGDVPGRRGCRLAGHGRRRVQPAAGPEAGAAVLCPGPGSGPPGPPGTRVRSGRRRPEPGRAGHPRPRRGTARALAWAGLAEEIGTGVLEREPVGQRRATLALTNPQTRASLRTNLAADAALAGLAEHRTRLPPWRIIAPPPAPTLLSFFRAAQKRFGVPWPYLAAIELVETRSGRIRGPSSAGAQGPMQFLPATWARYGHGSINDPRAAILAAARLLAANGAPADMAGALRHYNDSPGYVAAVTDYARRMARDPRAYYGYETWQVIYTYDHRTVILPVGFPSTRPMPLPSGLPPAPPIR